MVKNASKRSLRRVQMRAKTATDAKIFKFAKILEKNKESQCFFGGAGVLNRAQDGTNRPQDGAKTRQDGARACARLSTLGPRCL